MAKGIVGESLIGEKGAFTFTVDKKEEIREIPFVYYPNFIAVVAEIVYKHERQVSLIHICTLLICYTHTSSPSGLTWHNGAIPEDELWVKLGGDKGRGSFKFNIQLCNTTAPNSMKNTALLSVFKAGDTTTNLHIALDMYKEHVKEAQGMKIK